MVGATSTVLDFLILNSFGLVMNVYLATAFGFLAGSTNGYILNSHFVFKQQKNITRYVKYFFITFVGLCITELIIYAIHNKIGYRLNIAKLVAVILVFSWNYTGSRIWAFK